MAILMTIDFQIQEISEIPERLYLFTEFSQIWVSLAKS